MTTRWPPTLVSRALPSPQPGSSPSLCSNHTPPQSSYRPSPSRPQGLCISRHTWAPPGRGSLQPHSTEPSCPGLSLTLHLLTLGIFSQVPAFAHLFVNCVPLFLPQHLGQAGSGNEVTQSCPTLCNPIDCSLPGSSVHGIFQARTLEWVAISFSRRSSQPRD